MPPLAVTPKSIFFSLRQRYGYFVVALTVIYTGSSSFILNYTCSSRHVALFEMILNLNVFLPLALIVPSLGVISNLFDDKTKLSGIVLDLL